MIKKLRRKLFPKKEEKVWKRGEFPLTPHLNSYGLDLFKKSLAGKKYYLEYGSGGSTLLAGEIGVPTIHSVETNLSFSKELKFEFSTRFKESQLIVDYVDIGNTSKWGKPLKKDGEERGITNYPTAPWKRIPEGVIPDIILIDGRYRVASFLTCLLFCQSSSNNTETTILFDDYYDRIEYNCIEKFITPIGERRLAGMAEFHIGQSPKITRNEICSLIEEILKNPSSE
jgi:hypothetical protein